MIKCDRIWLEDNYILAQAGEDCYIYVGNRGQYQPTILDAEKFIASLHGCIGYHGWRRREDVTSYDVRS